MKKFSRLLIMALVLFIPFMVSVKADGEEENADLISTKDKINVYLFRGEGCPHCAEAEAWFDELDKDEGYSSYYNIVKYEVWNDQNNAALMQEVAKSLDTEANGVPFIVIGKKYFSGYASSMNDEIKSAIKEAYESSEYTDVVNPIVNGATEKTPVEKENNTFIPIIIVSAVGLITVIALIFFTKEK